MCAGELLASPCAFSRKFNRSCILSLAIEFLCKPSVDGLNFDRKLCRKLKKEGVLLPFCGVWRGGRVEFWVAFFMLNIQLFPRRNSYTEAPPITSETST